MPPGVGTIRFRTHEPFHHRVAGFDSPGDTLGQQDFLNVSFEGAFGGLAGHIQNKVMSGA